MTIRLHLPLPTPSLNVRKREHWSKTKTWRSRWGKLIWAEIARLGNRPALLAKGRRLVTIERHGKRPLDDDNRLGGCKELIDELCSYGLLIDDSTEWASIGAVDVKLAKGVAAHTVVKLENV